ncbi:MAG: septum formation protein Maf [Clostridia bacterium]|nr:septum formation protein Maf [Clostridia bacterium]
MNLTDVRVVLASKSPRRRELLGDIIKDFDIIVREVDEELSPEIHPSVGVGILAVRKGSAVAAELDESTLVISSDTLVELDGVPLGKPDGVGGAYKMLRLLSGKTHSVHTGVAVHYRGRVEYGVATSHVRFRELSDGEIYEYIETGEPMDKAGAYGIQGLGGKFVASYEGDFDTVVGLSRRLTRELIERALEND